METCRFKWGVVSRSLFVRIEVFPEKDGNELENDDQVSPIKFYVRIEVFPERDGNLPKRETHIS